VEADRTAPVYGTGEIEVAAGPETIGGVPGDIGEVVDEPTKLTWTGKTMAIPARGCPARRGTSAAVQYLIRRHPPWLV